MWMFPEPLATIDQVVIDHAQIAKTHMRVIMVSAKAKAVGGLEPTKVGFATLVCGTQGKAQVLLVCDVLMNFHGIISFPKRVFHICASGVDSQSTGGFDQLGDGFIQHLRMRF